jgi:hypothetical protein
MESGISIFDDLAANIQLEPRTSEIGALSYKTNSFLFEFSYGYNVLKIPIGNNVTSNFSTYLGLGFGLDLMPKSNEHDLIFLGGTFAKLYDKCSNLSDWQ